jgi:hypothetical protein
MSRSIDITPADQGIIAAIIDQAMDLQAGDDETVAWAASNIRHELRVDEAAAWSLAYDEFRRRLGCGGKPA